MLKNPFIIPTVTPVLAVLHQQLILSGIQVPGNGITVGLAAVLGLQDTAPLIGRLSPHRRIVGTIRSDT